MSRFGIQAETIRNAIASLDNSYADIINLKKETTSVRDSLRLSRAYSSTIENSLNTTISNLSKCASSLDILHRTLSNSVESYLTAENNVLDKITDGRFLAGVIALSGTAIGSQIVAQNIIQYNPNRKSTAGGGKEAFGSGEGGGFRGEEALDDKSRSQSTNAENSTHEPLYISNPTFELDSIEDKMRNAKDYDDLTWNNPYENGVHSISCVWFSNEKVRC